MLALIAFGDTLKPGARAAIERLKRDGHQERPAHWRQRRQRGQRRDSARHAPDEVHAQMLPEDKARVIAN